MLVGLLTEARPPKKDREMRRREDWVGFSAFLSFKIRLEHFFHLPQVVKGFRDEKHAPLKQVTHTFTFKACRGLFVKNIITWGGRGGLAKRLRMLIWWHRGGGFFWKRLFFPHKGGGVVCRNTDLLPKVSIDVMKHTLPKWKVISHPLIWALEPLKLRLFGFFCKKCLQ